MCAYFSEYSLTIGDGNDTDNTTNSVNCDYSSDLSLHDQCSSHNQKFSSSMDNLLRDLFPDLVGISSLKTISAENISELPTTSREIGNSFIENESLTSIPSPKKENINQNNKLSTPHTTVETIPPKTIDTERKNTEIVSQQPSNNEVEKINTKVFDEPPSTSAETKCSIIENRSLTSTPITKKDINQSYTLPISIVTVETSTPKTTTNTEVEKINTKIFDEPPSTSAKTKCSIIENRPLTSIPSTKKVTVNQIYNPPTSHAIVETSTLKTINTEFFAKPPSTSAEIKCYIINNGVLTPVQNPKKEIINQSYQPPTPNAEHGTNIIRIISTEVPAKTPPTSGKNKCSIIENKPLTSIPKPKKKITSQNDSTAIHGGIDVVKIEDKLPTAANASDNRLKNTMPEKLIALSPHYSLSISICNDSEIGSVYEYAINKISIDDNNELRDEILKEVRTIINQKGFTESSIDLSPTHANIRKYIIHKFSPHINRIMRSTDILITPDMLIKNIPSYYILNKNFFDRLNEYSKKVEKLINEIHHEEFIPLIQGRIFFDSYNFLTLKRKNKRKRISSVIKILIVNTVSNLSNKIIHEINKFGPNDILRGIFFRFHGTYVTKSFVRKIVDFCNIINKKMMNDKPLNKGFIDYKTLIDNSMEKLEIAAKTSPILHEGKLFLPNKTTAELMIRYLSRDINKICHKMYCNLYSKEITPSRSAKNSESLSNWNLNEDPYEGVYKYTMSTIAIDVGNFGSIVSDYYSELAGRLLNEIGDKLQLKIELNHGMTTKELELAYTSNEEFFSKLRELINLVTCRLRKHDDPVISRIIEYTNNRKSILVKQTKYSANDVSEFLIKNISILPQKIVNAIKSLPKCKLLGEFFYFFQDMYVDNKSILKVKETFGSIQEKLINDPLLCKCVGEICDNIFKYVTHIGIKKKRALDAMIRAHPVTKDLSVFTYIKKTVTNQLKNDMKGPIMIICDEKLVIADNKTENIIMDKFKTYLIIRSIRMYKKICFEKFETDLARKRTTR
ncbi:MULTISPECIES: hypothetical protein [Candidatus Ichthyocystis]|uniref:Putative coiled coil protein n=1 Tax=Candidatus Ichthyocystis hellenicum TaxID=1561003 RepID=A0A0S4M4B7_9BURK|nr:MULTISPECIES: hypothetical protein [Ichthyocystis]CUT17820.1 putative coiled coil protein [Candidatus Ichthyocystis hellenicum]